MISEVEIVNIARARLGESPIQTFGEGTVPANMAKVFYAPARRAVLRSFDWNFSIKTVSLAKFASKPVDFRFAFALPVDCLRAIRLRREGVPDYTGETDIRFVVRSGVLYTDEEKALLEYVADVEDTSLFDDKFIEALGYKLAADLAMPVKGSPELMANYTNVYNDLIVRAAALTGQEERPAYSDNPYLEARNAVC